MIEHPDVVPIAVVAAVGVFLAREVLEGYRRLKTNSRKLDAIRTLLAAECERNDFAIKRMLGQVADIAGGLKKKSAITIERTARDVPRLAIRDVNAKLSSSSPVPLIHTAILEKYLFEAASLNNILFQQMEKTLDGLTEARHIRDGIIEYVSDDPFHLEGFVDGYAPTELNDSLDSVRDLYFTCNLQPLTRGRVR